MMPRKNVKAKLKDYKESRGPPSNRFRQGASPTTLPQPLCTTTRTNPPQVPGPQHSRTIKKAGRRLSQPTLQEMVKLALVPGHELTPHQHSLPHPTPTLPRPTPEEQGPGPGQDLMPGLDQKTGTTTSSSTSSSTPPPVSLPQPSLPQPTLLQKNKVLAM